MEKQLHEQELAERDPRVALQLATEELKPQGIDPNSESLDAAAEKKVADALQCAQAKVREMSREEYEKQLPPIEAQDIRQTLIGSMYDPQLRKMGLNPDFQRIYPEQSEAAHKAVLEQVNAMTPEQQRAELKKLSPARLESIVSRKDVAKDRYTLAPPRPDELPPKPIAGADEILSRLLGIGVIVFALIAIAAAFRIAAGAVIV